MTNSSHHHARFIPSEEIDAQAVRHWQFGRVDQALPVGAGTSHFAEMATLDELLPPTARQGLAAPAPMDTPAEPDEATVRQLREAEMETLLEQARQEAHEAGYQAGMQEGQAQGMEQGIEKGREAASAEFQQKMDAIQAQQRRQISERLRSIIHSAQKQVDGMHHALADDLLRLSSDIARQVVRQELRCNPQALMPVVREALDMLGAELKPALVRLNPDDWAQLEDALKAANPQPKIEWLADASVKPGDCLVESAGAQVDASLERRWQRAVAALGLVSTWYDGAPSHGA
jgi:flagellar assembly protein FliH